MGVRTKMNYAEFIPMDISYLAYPRNFMFCIPQSPQSPHGKAVLKGMRVRPGCRSGQGRLAIHGYDFDPSFPHLGDKRIGRKEQDSPSHLRPPRVLL